MGRVGKILDAFDQTIQEFCNAFDNWISILRIADVTDLTSQEENEAIIGPAGAALGVVGALSVLNTGAKLVREDDKAECASTHYLLYRLQREVDKMVDRLEDKLAIDHEGVQKVHQQFFDELEFTAEEDLAPQDAETEFADLEDYLHLSPYSAVSKPRRLGRRLLDKMGMGKRRGRKSYHKLVENSERYESYLGLELEEYVADEIGKKEEVQTRHRTTRGPGLRRIIAQDIPLDSLEETSPPTPPEEKDPYGLNTWEKWFSVIFLLEENEFEEEPGLLGTVARTYGKIKKTISTTWDGLGNYSLFYWVAWASVWATAGAAATATSLATALTLGIPLLPAVILFTYNLFKGKEDPKKVEAAKQQEQADNLFFTKAHIQIRRYEYEKMYAMQRKIISNLTEKIGERAGKNKGKERLYQEAEEVDSDVIRKTLNAKHATLYQVWKYASSLRIFDAISLIARLAWANVIGKSKEEIAYKSPTEEVLARLDSKYGKNRSVALNLISGFFNGSIITAFAAWPITSALVFAGVGAAGGPLAQLICYGLAASFGVFSMTKQVTTANIEAKKQQKIIEANRPHMENLIAEEKQTEYLRLQLKDGYKQIAALGALPGSGLNERDIQAFKPVLTKKDLVTDDRFFRRKTTESSFWTPVKKTFSRALHTLGSAETGILAARMLFYAGGVFSLLGELGVIGSLGTSLPLSMLISFGLIYGGIKLHEYCVNKQRERDMKIVENAKARLEGVKENNAFLTQQLIDQQAMLATLRQEKKGVTLRAVNNSVALIRSRLDQEPAVKFSPCAKQTDEVSASLDHGNTPKGHSIFSYSVRSLEEEEVLADVKRYPRSLLQSYY